MDENAPKKSIFPKKIRIIALILAVLLAGEIIFSNSVAVSFSSGKYADSEYEQAAEYIEQNDSYLVSGGLARMRAAVSMLGEPKTYDQFSLFSSVAIADEEYAKAADYLLKAVEMYNGDNKGLSVIYIKIGCLKALDGNWGAAGSFFEKAIELDETASGAWLMLCETNLNTGNYEEALSCLEKYSAFASLSDDEFDALIQLQLNLKKYDEALASCEKAEKDSNIPASDIALYRAQIYYMKGEYENALEYAEKCRTEGGDIEKANSIISVCAELKEDYKRAVDAYGELIDKGLADLSVYQQAAQDAYFISDFETVIRISEEAIKKFGENDDTAVFKKWLGISYFETNDIVNAEKYLRAMLEIGENIPELNYLLGICEMSNGKYEEAIADFTSALTSEELIDEALYNRALCYIKLEDTDSASVDLQQVIDRNKDQEIIAMICELLEITPEQLEQSRQSSS